jgi:metal-dependent hydrolase (beta-lactamase superfamily II)
MVVKVLMENTAVSGDFQTEHGLSLYVETGGYRLLFDTGASGLFLENAKKLDVDIAKVDFAVISHGHYDHGGGLKPFLAQNTKPASLCIRRRSTATTPGGRTAASNRSAWTRSSSAAGALS